eukprot:scaffold29455_cov84-Isochrysis_galbana.AAC.2
MPLRHPCRPCRSPRSVLPLQRRQRPPTSMRGRPPMAGPWRPGRVECSDRSHPHCNPSSPVPPPWTGLPPRRCPYPRHATRRRRVEWPRAHTSQPVRMWLALMPRAAHPPPRRPKRCSPPCMPAHGRSRPA